MADIKFCLIEDVQPILKNPKKEFSAENPIKAYKLTIDTGTEKRTVVSAITELFTQDELLGKTTTFELSLPPKEIRGFVSEGMIHLNQEEPISLYLGGEKGTNL